MYLGEDDGLNRLLDEAYGASPVKTEFLDSVKGHPSVVTHCSAGSSFMAGYRDCLAQHRPELDVWSVKLLSPLGSEDVLLSDAESMRAHVQELLSRYRRPAKPTPAKVLTKMLSLRLEKVIEKVKANRKAVSRESERLQESLKDPKWGVGPDGRGEWRASQASRLRGMEGQWCVPDLSTASRDELVAWSKECKAKSWEGRAVYQELENALLREDATDEVLRAACDVFMVKDVMAS